MCNFFFCFFAGAFYAPAGAEKWQRHPRGVPLLYIRPVPGSETPGEYLFLMPLFGGAGQTGEGREGQTGVEEDTGVTRFGGAGRILRLGGRIIVVGAQLGACCGTADGAGLGGGVGGGLPFVGRLRIYVRTAIAGALVPMLVIVVLPGSGKGMVKFWN